MNLELKSKLVEPYAWVSVQTPSTRITTLQALNAADGHHVVRLPPGSKLQILVTVVAKVGSRFEVVGSVRAVPSPFADLRFVSAPLRRVNKSTLTITEDSTTRSVSCELLSIWRAVEPPQKQRAQDENGLQQTVAACVDGTETTSLAYGFPFLKRVFFAGGRPVGCGLWQRYCDRAVILTGFTGTADDASFAELDNLLAVSLQGCTGVYTKERVDDRGIVETLFGVNNDCDDQSATVCALCLALLTEPTKPDMSKLSGRVLHHLRSTYTSCAVVVGFARSPSAADTSKPFGHAWAAVLRREGTFGKGDLHVEPTAPMAPRAVDKGRMNRVMNSSAYDARSAACLAVMQALKIKGNRVVGTRAVENWFYGQPLSATTPVAHYMWPRNSRAPTWLELLTEPVTRQPPQSLTLPEAIDPDELHHLPDRTLHVPTGYHVVTPQTPAVKAPPGWVGVVAKSPQLPLGPNDVVVDAFNVMTFV